jgi:hypothetical protein
LGVSRFIFRAGAGDHRVPYEKRPQTFGAAGVCGTYRREGAEPKDHTIHQFYRVYRDACRSRAGSPLPLVSGVSLRNGSRRRSGGSWVSHRFFLYKENTFASATIEVAPEQKVISTGLYALVRHPMYVGGFLLFVGMSLALGSWWGLFVFLLIVPALIWRIFDEEKVLAKNLPGYSEYQNKVKYRLIPFVW